MRSSRKPHSGGVFRRAQDGPVNRALWFIESHFGEEITLDGVAEYAGVSPYHLTRAFGDATGFSLMRYVRSRRLAEAARGLAGGAPDILSVALEAGYGSHEAFTRAFHDEFGQTPESVRAQRHINNLQILEATKMQETLTKIEAPRLEQGRELLIAGISRRYSCETSAGIPSQWQIFVPYLGTITGQTGRYAYGVTYNSDPDSNFDYLCGVEVSSLSSLPPDFSHVKVPAQQYAVFSHRDHISTIRNTWNSIWNAWLPESEYEVLRTPNFERYGPEFNSQTGAGGLEIWLPVKSKSAK